MYPLLDTIDDPVDVKRLSHTQLAELATEVRQRIREVVAAKGGHLAAGLGATELAIATGQETQGKSNRSASHNARCFGRQLSSHRGFSSQLR